VKGWKVLSVLTILMFGSGGDGRTRGRGDCVVPSTISVRVLSTTLADDGAEIGERPALVTEQPAGAGTTTDAGDVIRWRRPCSM
jgi:hypothetical protein